MKQLIIILTSAQLLTGCCSLKSQRALEPVAIDEALASVGRGLALMKNEQTRVSGKEKFQTGLMPSELEINFVVSKAKTQNGKLYVELSPTADLVKEITGKVGGEYSVESTRNAGNTINIKFKSLLFATTTTSKDEKTNDVVKVQGITNPKILKELYEVIENEGITEYFTPPTE